MKVSGRNKLSGMVQSIKRDGILAQVTVAVPGPGTVVATITGDAVDDLGLKEGDSVQALVKATNVMIMK
ncbi:MAG: TOBE domain-containing protein [Bacillota bacterium]